MPRRSPSTSSRRSSPAASRRRWQRPHRGPRCRNAAGDRHSPGRIRGRPAPIPAPERAMLGPAKSRRLDAPIAVSLEDLVPADNFYRHVEATLDLSFVREWVQELYAERGRPSIDPVVFFKLQLVMFFEGIRSERQLIEMASLNLAHRWYLGYALDEPLPDHSSLSRIRTRLGIEVFQRFFERIVELCQAAGLVWGQELLFDATKVRANADLDSLVPRFYWNAKQHLAELFDEENAPSTAEGAVTAPLPAPA